MESGPLPVTTPLPPAQPPKMTKLAAPYPGGQRRRRPRGRRGADPRGAECSAAGDETRARGPAGWASCPRRWGRGDAGTEGARARRAVEARALEARALGL